MDVYLGMIMIFGGNFAPQGWAMCQGQLVPIAQNSALYSLLGTLYGGDGSSTFGLPNLRGRVPIGMGGTYPQGQVGGAENATLTVGQLPAHSHGVVGQSGYADTLSPAGAFPAQNGNRNNTPPGINVYTQATSTPVAMAQGMIAPTGNNQPVPTLPPYLAVNYIISLTGIYPPRS